MSKRILLSLLAVPLLLAACESAPDTGDLDTLDEQMAYIIGFGFGSDLNEQLGVQDVELDRDLILAAAREGLRGDTMRFSDDEINTIMRAFQDTLMAQMTRSNASEGEAYLADIAEQDSIETTESGLLYKVLREGEGESPAMGETVVVNYRGTLPDGTVFDSSYDRGQPQQFRVGEVIPGWNEALQLMKPGSHWMLYIPSDLAYGDQGRPPIGPSRALTFEVELIDVIAAEE